MGEASRPILPIRGEGDHRGAMVEGDLLDAPPSGRAARSFRQALTRLPPPRERGGSGFTLIEIIVALAVFSLAALALLRLEGQTVFSARLLDETMVAQMVARNLVVEAITDPRVPPRGLTQGVEQNGARAWRWQRVVQPLGDQGAFRIDVTVAGPEGRVLGRLSAVRPPALPPRQPPARPGATPPPAAPPGTPLGRN